MSPKRFHYLMLGIVCTLALGVLGLTYAANSVLKSKAAELTELRLENQVIELQQSSITQAKKDIEKYSELESIAKSVVPQEKDQAKTVREIIKIADESGIPVSNIAFPSSNLGDKPTVITPTEGAASPNQTTTLSQVKPVPGITGVYQLEITVNTPANSSISYSQLIEFLERLEQNRRTSQVSNITIRPKQITRQNSRLSFTLGLTVYIKP